MFLSENLFLPFTSAALIHPHAADILQEACGIVDTTLVGEVAFLAFSVDDSLRCLYAHEAPRAAAEIGEMLVLCRYGSYGTGCVVTGNSDNGHGSESCELLHFRRERAENGARHSHGAKDVAGQTECAEQCLVEVAGGGIEQLRRRCHGVLADSLTGEHVSESIRNEENLPGSF